MDYYDILKQAVLAAPASFTATGNTASVDVHGCTGTAIVELFALNTAGTAPTLNVVLQDSPDNATFTNIPNAAFAQVGAAASNQTFGLILDSVNRHIRAVITIAGTNAPAYVVSVTIFAQPQYL